MESIKVLIPTDFSVQAEYAYLMVKKLAEKAAMDIHFVHVLNVPDTVTMDTQGKIETCGEIDVNYIVSQKEIADRKLGDLKSQYGNDIKIHLVLGKTTDAVVDFATKNHFDLITMGTKGAWGWKEKLSGSETQMIARRSPIPVLSLMCDRSDLVIKNILLVHHFDGPNKQDLTLMHKLVRAFSPNIHFLYIATTTDKNEHLKITDNMKAFADANSIKDYSAHILLDRDIESGVIHFNEMNNMDIICIGTHGKSGLLHTSSTEKLINHMFKPIISYRITD